MLRKTLLSIIIGILLILITVSSSSGLAQRLDQWSSQQNVPGYWHETEPPILIPDQNHTVHAFTSQQIDEESGDMAIFYNQWTANQGWSIPVDILLTPFKNKARLLGAYLDQSSIFHIIFYGGDNTGANVYYAKAHAANADQTGAWSKPVLLGKNALDPHSGTISGDGQGNLVILYSGRLEGNGVYTQISTDSGETWSDPVSILLAREVIDQELFPFYFHMHLAQSGWLYAVWSMNDINNRGQAIYFSKYSFLDQQWSQPQVLAETQGGLGTQAPTIIEYEDELLVMYYSAHNGKQNFIRSDNGGLEWSEPVTPFPHRGLNGPGSFVIDSNKDLHFFWGQRISGSPDIHGMWHSVWLGERWSNHEAIVSGERVLDLVGYDSFDPVTPHAVNVQGNVVLVTWRTDYGLKANGVWYSHKVLEAPELPVVPLPTQKPLPTDTPTATQINTVSTSTPVNDLTGMGNIPPPTYNNPVESLVPGIITAFLVLILMVGLFVLSRQRAR